jgi:hypothetical protein
LRQKSVKKTDFKQETVNIGGCSYRAEIMLWQGKRVYLRRIKECDGLKVKNTTPGLDVDTMYIAISAWLRRTE